MKACFVFPLMFEVTLGNLPDLATVQARKYTLCGFSEMGLPVQWVYGALLLQFHEQTRGGLSVGVSCLQRSMRQEQGFHILNPFCSQHWLGGRRCG
jgi:hypothetical protein